MDRWKPYLIKIQVGSGPVHERALCLTEEIRASVTAWLAKTSPSWSIAFVDYLLPIGASLPLGPEALQAFMDEVEAAQQPPPVDPLTAAKIGPLRTHDSTSGTDTSRSFGDVEP